MMTVNIYFKNEKCGELQKLGDDSFEFKYDSSYIEHGGMAISLSLPTGKIKFSSKSLFPFFDGLIPEGWLLRLAQKELRLNINKDRFELLKALCQQTIGAVHIGDTTNKIIEKDKSKKAVEPTKNQYDRCLVCYEDLSTGNNNEVYHQKCMKSVYQGKIIPFIYLDEKTIETLGKKSLQQHKTITGVQRKISLDITPSKAGAKANRLTITNLWGKFILKPKGPAPHYPENEHLCMLLAQAVGIETERCALIPMKDNQLGFIARRFDRGDNNEEYHQEDFCQILEQAPHQKYTGSYEQVAKVLKLYSHSPGNDRYRLFELILFNFIVGNVDHHLKNISLKYEDKNGRRTYLAPAYDLLSTDLYIDDDEQTALAINGKKNKLQMKDFLLLAKNFEISEKVFKSIIDKFHKKHHLWQHLIHRSFLSEKDKTKIKKIIQRRLDFFQF